jgi:nucleoside-diphosphate-sugar epimerase
MSDQVALVVGSSGIIGNALAELLRADADRKVRIMQRSARDDFEVVPADLTDAHVTREALRRAADTTHVFYAALKPSPDRLAEEARVNGDMLRNLLDGLKAVGAPLQRVVHYQGAKVYGVHLGVAHAPFYEDAPRHVAPNFYYEQEDILIDRAARGELEWSILRPDVVVGDIAGNPMNIAMVIGAFAALSALANAPLRFPGSYAAYRDVFTQVTDSQWLARASLWAALAPSARNEAFNLVGELTMPRFHVQQLTRPFA